MLQQLNMEEVNLLDLPSMPLLEKSSLPSIPCVYFVVSPECEILYIGKAVSLKSRWVNHHRYETLIVVPGATIIWMEIREIEQLVEIEKQAIIRFNPRLNNKPITTVIHVKEIPSLNCIDTEALMPLLKTKIFDAVEHICKTKGRNFGAEIFRLGISTEKSCRDSTDYNERRDSLGRFAIVHIASLMDYLVVEMEKNIKTVIESTFNETQK